jgi:large conductance mechanosensitive channel
MLKEFKEFINHGNVVDLAVAVVIGAAFGAVVKSFTDDVLMQIIAAIFGKPDFSNLTFELGDGVIRYGAFINAVIAFVIIAFALFLVVKALNAAKRKKKVEEAAAPAGPTEVELLTEIRDQLARR